MTTPDWLERTSLLMGPDKMERFRRAHVLVVGTGGVGAYAAGDVGTCRNRTVDVVGCRPGATEQYQPSVVCPAFDGRRGKSPRVGAAF